MILVATALFRKTKQIGAIVSILIAFSSFSLLTKAAEAQINELDIEGNYGN